LILPLTQWVLGDAVRQLSEWRELGLDMEISANIPDGSLRQLAAAQVAGVIDVSAGQGSEADPAPFVRPEAAVATFTDGNGNTSTTELDKFGAGTQSEDALTRITTTERNADGKPIRSVASNGRVSEMTYDERGNLLSLTEAVGDPLERVTSFEYEPVFNQVTKITDPRNNDTTFDYDANGNLIEVEDAALTRTTLAYGDANCPGLATGVTRAVGLAEETTTTFSYDPVTCNLLTTTDDLGNPTSMAYDAAGNTVSVTDALLRESRFVYDELNRVTKSIDASNSDPAPACGLAGVTCFAFDAGGNLIDLTDANGNVTSFDYDERERVTDRTDPLLNAETFSYDGQGNLRFATDRKGQVIEFQYDLANRPIKKIMQPGQPEEAVRDIDYDLMNNVTSVTDPDSALAFGYDLLDRLETASTAGSPFQPAVALTAGYDANSNRTTLDDPVGQSVFVYDALNRLTDLTTPSLPGQPILYSFDPLSRRTGVSLPNGVDTSLTFDTASRLTDISHVLGGVTTVSSFGYGHDSVNNRTSLTQTRSTVSVQTALSYVYDDLDRLTQATHPQVAAADETFGYDPLGNRLNRDGQVVDSVFDGANRLIEDQDFTYAYDLNGNLESKTAKMGGAVTDYTWDAEDRLTRIDLPGGGFAEYLYDGIGRRIQKDANGAVTRYVYDGSDILLEYDGLNLLLARYTHGSGIDDQVMVERDIDSSGSFDASERFFYLGDGLGSVTELTDSAGAAARTLVYDSYGQIVQDTGGVAQPFAFTGREFDAESGLYFYRARYYDAATGRFLSEDPLGFVGGDGNLYRYVLNNPVRLVDPSGEIAIAAPIIIGAAIGGGFELGRQLVVNDFDLGCLDYSRLGVAVVSGAAAGGFGAVTAGLPTISAVAANAIAGGGIGAGAAAVNGDDIVGGARFGFLGGGAGSAAGKLVTSGALKGLSGTGRTAATGQKLLAVSNALTGLHQSTEKTFAAIVAFGDAFGSFLSSTVSAAGSE
jgi:RHS repeat-associated protein